MQAYLRAWLLRYLRKSTHPAARLRRFMKYYPPFFFQRVLPLYIAPDLSVAHVMMKRSLLTLNLNGSFFGGSIMAAIDPWYGLLIAQKAAREGIPVEIWVQELHIHFTKATKGHLYFTCSLPQKTWAELQSRLLTEGRFRYTLSFEIFGSEGFLCAKGTQTLYLRNLALYPRRSANS